MGIIDGEGDEAAVVYKIKVVQFLGRAVPIILQNDNGPCPLIAICNVLLLRNNVTLSTDISDISLQNLLTLVAERLLDSNSNTEDKDEDYIQNQQQNIADAIQLLPRLATGIDVNVRFKNIHDFEFTSECAIFDLLDIGLVHGWLCDPQDEVTNNAIGDNSYNVLVEKLVALHSVKPDTLEVEEPTVDFAAATTASLGVPSPHVGRLSRNSSEISDTDFSDDGRRRKGDDEEAAELLEALHLSQMGATEMVATPLNACGTNEASDVNETDDALDADGVSDDFSYPAGTPEVIEPEEDNEGGYDATALTSVGSFLLENATMTDNMQTLSQPAVAKLDTSNQDCANGPEFLQSSASLKCWVTAKEDLDITSVNCKKHVTADSEFNAGAWTPGEPNHHDENMLILKGHATVNISAKDDDLVNAVEVFSEDVPATEFTRFGDSVMEELLYEGEAPLTDQPFSHFENGEPIYEGEAPLTDQPFSHFENGEPIYEGEAILAQQADRLSTSDSSHRSGDANLSNAVTEGLIIENFLTNNASQLTYYGLFCLQEGLKERELCVFFRNNHFSAMFKYSGDLYLLATDQGYLNQPDLVWEKLTEVGGDTIFTTGNFTLFQVDSKNNSWNERDALTATSDFMSSQKVGTLETDHDTKYNSDLQLAMALQQQELEQQQQQQQQQQQSRVSASSQGKPSPNIGTGRLYTGPRAGAVPPKPEPKNKDKCTVM